MAGSPFNGGSVDGGGKCNFGEEKIVRLSGREQGGKAQTEEGT